jgi:hypothetical protein
VLAETAEHSETLLDLLTSLPHVGFHLVYDLVAFAFVRIVWLPIHDRKKHGA